MSSIVTVGVSPAWDVKCICENIGWSAHVNAIGKEVVPAGKALNVSKALDWMGAKSVAMGLWGRDDYKKMRDSLKSYKRINIKMTEVKGATRENIWVYDSKTEREIHLRFANPLATNCSVAKLKKDIDAAVKADDVVVFSGSMAENSLNLVRLRAKKNKVALDCSGDVLGAAVRQGGLWTIKPNIDELRELVGSKIADRPAAIVKACEKLLDKVEVILVSRGAKGAILVSLEGSFLAEIASKVRPIKGTVACGDYSLAGFLYGFDKFGSLKKALESAIVAGAARAYGYDSDKFETAKRKIKVSVSAI